MARQFFVEITETVVYSNTYTLEEIARHTGWSLSDLESLSDEQIADLIDGDENVESDLQGYGDVQGSSWVIQPEG